LVKSKRFDIQPFHLSVEHHRIDRTYISALERARYSATIDIVDKLAKALDIDPGALLQRSARQRKS
jgi:transcriptional regulator with XRE-family HTH domain